MFYTERVLYIFSLHLTVSGVPLCFHDNADNPPSGGYCAHLPSKTLFAIILVLSRILREVVHLLPEPWGFFGLG